MYLEFARCSEFVATAIFFFLIRRFFGFCSLFFYVLYSRISNCLVLFLFSFFRFVSPFCFLLQFNLFKGTMQQKCQLNFARDEFFCCVFMTLFNNVNRFRCSMTLIRMKRTSKQFQSNYTHRTLTVLTTLLRVTMNLDFIYNELELRDANESWI